ncbi:MAG: hypothetical protein Q8N84_02095 [bacterium]|nr:hypothetical protein [bacterium]
MPTFKNARKTQPVIPTKKVTSDLAEEIRPLSPREFPLTEANETPPAPPKPTKKVAAVKLEAPLPPPPPPPPPPPKIEPAPKLVARVIPSAPPPPPVKSGSRFKAFVAGFFIGGCLSPVALMAGFFWVFTFATPSLSKQLTNIIPPEVKGLFTIKEPTSSPVVSNEEPQSTATPVIRVQPTNCGQNATCLLLAARNYCQSADGVIIKKGLETKISIIDEPFAGTCQIMFLGLRALDGMDRVISLVNKGMTCYFPMATITEATFSLEYDSQLRCSGPMWDELKSQNETLPSTTTPNETPSTTPLE